MLFVRLISGGECPNIAMCCFDRFGKRASFHTKKKDFYRKENMFGVGFKILKPLQTRCAHRDVAVEQLHQPCNKRGLIVKKARVVFIANHNWVWCSFMEWHIHCK